ncbi:MAG: hypothetical protein ABI212_00270 [Burkholderiaceae bacterium]
MVHLGQHARQARIGQAGEQARARFALPANPGACLAALSEGLIRGAIVIALAWVGAMKLLFMGLAPSKA